MITIRQLSEYIHLREPERNRAGSINGDQLGREKAIHILTKKKNLMYIPIILGTAREGRESEKVARFMLAKTVEFGLESEILDVRDYRLPATDDTRTSDAASRLKERVLRADGLVIVSPEYNHGYPGELKMMLDMLYEEYFGKPVGICGVSSGVFGGARMIEHLVATCVRFHMLPTGQVLYFPRVQELFDESGAIKKEAYHRRAKKFLTILAEYAEALKRRSDAQS